MPPRDQADHAAAALHRIVLIQINARPERLQLTALYRLHFLAVINVLSFSQEARTHCALLPPSVVCKDYSRTWQDFQRPVGEILLALAEATDMPNNYWLKKYRAQGVEPLFSKYVPAQFRLKHQADWVMKLKESPGPDRLARCTGFLVSHMDFWMDPARFPEGLHPDRLWRLGPGIPRPNHAKGKDLCIRVLSDELQVRQTRAAGSSSTRTLRRGDVELVEGGMNGIRGISQRLNMRESFSWMSWRWMLLPSQHP